MEEVLHVEPRQSRGKHPARRLRRSGKIPAVIYGQNQETVSLAVGSDALHTIIRHRGRLVEFAGAATGNALIQAIQWDPFGTEILHVDFMRVAADQEIRVAVAVQLRGDAPGVKAGGVLEQLVRSVELEVRATAIPDILHVNVNELQLGESIRVSQIEDLPAGAKLVGDPDAVVVHCVEPEEEVEPEDLSREAAEPELIGGGKAEDEGEHERG